jgi:hypothetical protein
MKAYLLKVWLPLQRQWACRRPLWDRGARAASERRFQDAGAQPLKECAGLGGLTKPIDRRSDRLGMMSSPADTLNTLPLSNCPAELTLWTLCTRDSRLEGSHEQEGKQLQRRLTAMKVLAAQWRPTAGRVVHVRDFAARGYFQNRARRGLPTVPT